MVVTGRSGHEETRSAHLGLVSLRWVVPTAATVAGAAAAAAPAVATLIAVPVAVALGLLILLLILLCAVAVFGSEAHSERAIKVLTVLFSRGKAESPEGGEASSSS